MYIFVSERFAISSSQYLMAQIYKLCIHLHSIKSWKLRALPSYYNQVSLNNRNIACIDAMGEHRSAFETHKRHLMSLLLKTGYVKSALSILEKIDSFDVFRLKTNNPIGGLGHHWLRQWFVACLAPSHYLNQYWHSVNWTPRNNFQWNLNENNEISFTEQFCVLFQISPKFVLHCPTDSESEMV